MFETRIWLQEVSEKIVVDSRPGFKRLLDGLIVNPYTEDD